MFGTSDKNDLRLGTLQAPTARHWELRVRDSLRKPNETLQQSCAALLEKAERLMSSVVSPGIVYADMLQEATVNQLRGFYEALAALFSVNKWDDLIGLRNQLHTLDALLTARLHVPSSLNPKMALKKMESPLNRLNDSWIQQHGNFSRIIAAPPSNRDLYQQAERFCQSTNKALNEARIYQLTRTLREILNALQLHIAAVTGQLNQWLDALGVFRQEMAVRVDDSPVLLDEWQPEYVRLQQRSYAQLRKAIVEHSNTALTWKWRAPRLTGTSADIGDCLQIDYGSMTITSPAEASRALKGQADFMFESVKNVLDVFDLIDQIEHVQGEKQTAEASERIIPFLAEAAVSPVQLARPKAGHVAAQLLLPVLNRPSEQRQQILDDLQTTLRRQFNADCQPYTHRGWLTLLVNRQGIALVDVPTLNGLLKANPARSRQHSVFPAERTGALYEKRLNARLSPLALRFLERGDVLETLIRADASQVWPSAQSDDDFLQALQTWVGSDERFLPESWLRAQGRQAQHIAAQRARADAALQAHFEASLSALDAAADVPAEFQTALRRYTLDSAIGEHLHHEIAEIMFWTRYLIRPLMPGTTDASRDIAKVKHVIITEWIQMAENRAYQLLANSPY